MLQNTIHMLTLFAAHLDHFIRNKSLTLIITFHDSIHQ